MSAELDSHPRIGRYEIIRTLGEGGMGMVFLARDPALDRMVAIKTVRLNGIPESARRGIEERFKNEARAVAKLRHGSVVAVHDTGIDMQMGAYSVFEYVPGETLREGMDHASEPLGLRAAIRVVRSVAEALDAAHKVGIVHRDVKPANILLAVDGSVKLADFGVARLSDAHVTRDGMFLGTPAYAAPEALAQGEFGPATDVWALAVVAYELLVGRHPFEGHDVASVSNKVLHSDPDDPFVVRPALGRQAADLLLRALSKDPSKRPASALDLSRSLEECLGDDAADEASLASRSRSVARWWIGIGALVLAVAGGALAVRASLHMRDVPSVPDAAVEQVRQAGPRVHAARPAPGTDPIVRVAPDAAASPVGAPPSVVPPASPREEEEQVKSLLDEGRACLRASDIGCARAAFERVLVLDPGHPEARRLLRSLPE